MPPRRAATAPDPTGSAADFLPERLTLPSLRRAAAGCRGCELYKRGTQTVFGEGRRAATVMFVGEQPGDQEDRAGRPFVGPAGKLLDSVLDEAGIERDDVYVTNAVKHFKWEPKERSERRIHKKPNDSEISACRPWLDAEIEVVHPDVIVCLGATAAQSLLGKAFRVTRDRGKPFEVPYARAVFATMHPSSVLRAPSDRRQQARKDLVSDLKKVARYLGVSAGKVSAGLS